MTIKINSADNENAEVRIHAKPAKSTMVRSPAEQGPPGKSAYQHALDQGFVGTMEEWLESLRGSSAYQVALDNGFVGTEQQWLDSLIMGLSVREEDAGKYLTNDGSETIWETLQDGINKENVNIDEGSL